MNRKLLNFINEIGTIMYVGGILSHIVIGATLGHEEAITAYHVGVYKEVSAYILILPGLGLKVFADLYEYFKMKYKPNWLKAKLMMLTFLSINAFVFLVPMMPELVSLAKVSLPNEVVNDAYLKKAQLEQWIGMSNALPLVAELLLGSFKPKLFSERNEQTK
ncbi:enoyl-CoA hydratase [Photobacterium damselae]|uniref:Enoyl-CoA hydratase n=2 Tax=Photobacterium damselae TaxID=38293 RepID=A0ACD3SZZ8_PHODM|nr:enoyl-CoA hydratase [Photobacterium damselae]RDL29313.1 enoyl-CoA hydratase [Photobacterium damselae]TMX46678.1 enoyl-CoA hydratase [Photobacterium damselae]TMX74201.1 enoyl-CoA hydratase [Photobacterium damselae]